MNVHGFKRGKRDSFSSVPDVDPVRIDHGDAMAGEVGKPLREIVRGEHVVGIKEAQHGGISRVESSLTGCVDVLGIDSQILDAPSRKLLRDLWRVIPRRIVDHDNLKRLHRLIQDRLNRIGEKSPIVVRNDHHGHRQQVGLTWVRFWRNSSPANQCAAHNAP